MRKTYKEPKVYLIGQTEINSKGLKQYFKDRDLNTESWVDEDHDNKYVLKHRKIDSSYLPEFAGRNCYDSFSIKQGRKNHLDYIGNILEMKHESVLEHVYYNFIFTDVSRGFTHELVRHRHGSYSQSSTRYIDFKDHPVLFSNLLENIEEEDVKEALRKLFGDSYNMSIKMYNVVKEIIKERVGKGKKLIQTTARALLPIGIQQTITATYNVRSLREMFIKRCSPAAAYEIRKAFNDVFDIVNELHRSFYSDMICIDLPDGTFEVLQINGINIYKDNIVINNEGFGQIKENDKSNVVAVFDKKVGIEGILESLKTTYNMYNAKSTNSSGNWVYIILEYKK